MGVAGVVVTVGDNLRWGFTGLVDSVGNENTDVHAGVGVTAEGCSTTSTYRCVVRNEQGRYHTQWRDASVKGLEFLIPEWCAHVRHPAMKQRWAYFALYFVN